MNLEQKKELAFKVANEKGIDPAEALETIDFLIDSQLIKPREARLYLAVSSWGPRLRENDSRVKKTLLDLAVDYDVNEYTLRNILYSKERRVFK